MPTKARARPKIKKLDLTDKDIISYISSSRFEYIAQRDRSLNEENETERVACSQLLLITTVLLSASVILLSNVSEAEKLSAIQKILILTGVTSYILSIMSGIKYYFEIVKFNFNWAEKLNEVVKLFSEVKFESLSEARERTDEILEVPPVKTPKKWLYIQIIFLSVGVISYLLILVAILFNFDSKFY